MTVAGLSSAPFSLLSSSPHISNSISISISNSKFSTFETHPISVKLYSTSCNPSSGLSTLQSTRRSHISRPLQTFCFSSSVESAEFILEPNTNVKFETSLSLPGCSSPLSLLGTGYREKNFAIISVKVYAVGLYSNPSIIEYLSSWNGRSETEYRNDPAFFNSIFQAPMEKALQITLVRDIDGKTFWDALNDAISPRMKAPTSADESALSTFRSIFQGRPLKKGTIIFLAWLDPSKMHVSISSGGPPSIDATIESTGISLALFDVFLGDAPVSPSLKDAVCSGMAKILK